jgi:hypothetical protein
MNLFNVLSKYYRRSPMPSVGFLILVRQLPEPRQVIQGLAKLKKRASVSDLRQSRRLEIVNRSKRYSEKIL